MRPASLLQRQSRSLDARYRKGGADPYLVAQYCKGSRASIVKPRQIVDSNVCGPSRPALLSCRKVSVEELPQSSSDTFVIFNDASQITVDH